MPSIKISELPEISHFSTNTDATLFVGVDLITGTTGKSTLSTLGEGLYAYQPLKVGENQVLFSNTIGQFSGNSNTYLQINNQNFNANGSADYVASTSDSDNSNKYIDMGINGPTFNDPVYNAMRPYDGYVYVRGPTNTSTTGNLVIGTASSFANIVYIVGGTVTNNIVARMTKTDLQLSANYNIKFGDGSVQSVAASPANFSQAAFSVANTALNNTVAIQNVNNNQNTSITVIQGTNLSQNVRIDFSNTRMNILDNVNLSQNVRLNFSNTRISLNETVDVSQNVRLDFSNTAINSVDVKAQAAFDTANTALQNTTGTFAGSLTFTGNVTAIGGFIQVPIVYPSSQTAITIDMANNNLVRAQTATGLTVTLTGLVAGKECVAWITNTSGGGRTFTHGLSEINSTVNSLTYSIPGTSTILARYFSIDGSLQNTFVAITHA